MKKRIVSWILFIALLCNACVISTKAEEMKEPLADIQSQGEESTTPIVTDTQSVDSEIKESVDKNVDIEEKGDNEEKNDSEEKKTQDKLLEKSNIEQTKPVTQKGNWSIGGILPSDHRHKIGEPITLSTQISGNTEGFSFKYVWMRNNWKEWGVIRDFSSDIEATFMPQKLGEYTIIVDVKDSQGNVKSQSVKYLVVTHIWDYTGVTTNVPSPQEKYSNPIKITAQTSGETEGLLYKFVWQKNNWKEWGIIRNLETSPTVEWRPRSEGEYTILVDVKDQDGKVTTKSIKYVITRPNWKFDAIEVTPTEVQKKNEIIEIKGVTSGTTEKLQYKFVWMRDNWKEWGVIRPLSENNTVSWKTPNKSGEYTLFVDVKDRDGETRTKQLKYFVATQMWDTEKVNINNGISEQIYTNIPIEAITTGETKNLEYKFVWKKGGISEGWGNGWGVIRAFGKNNNTKSWYPKEAGKYTIYVDVKDVDGRKKTLTQEYDVLAPDWKFEKICLDGSPDRFVGDHIKATVETSGNTEGLQYKFVCRRGDGWSDWEVLREFSSNNSIEIPLTKAKDYHLIVDIKDKRGVTFDAKEILIRPHKYNSVKVSATNIGKGKAVTIYPDITGAQGELQFKYVWQKDNWKEWGVIKEFSRTSKISWTPPSVGTYQVIVDIKANDVTQSKSTWFTVKEAKEGWYYEGGYKFYYKNGEKQLDLDGILAKQANYYIKVNRKTCSVTVYAKDGNNGYIIPVKRFACSVGLPSTPTPTGTFYTPAKYRWRTLMGPSYGQYCTRITGSILFHSVAGRNMTSYNLNARDYNKLGQPASHGCVRLNVRDAKWIYDNCPLKTRVTIYDSSDPGPLGKPATIKIPAGQTWDPTDPNI